VDLRGECFTGNGEAGTDRHLLGVVGIQGNGVDGQRGVVAIGAVID
jgi:hypothetical protein